MLSRLSSGKSLAADLDVAFPVASHFQMLTVLPGSFQT